LWTGHTAGSDTGFTQHAPEALEISHGGVGWKVSGGQGRRGAVEGYIEARGKMFNEAALSLVEVIGEVSETSGLRRAQLYCEMPGLGPVDQDEAAHDGMAVDATQDMLPDPIKGTMRLSNVKDYLLVADEVEIVRFPGRRRGFVSQELNQGDGNFLVGKGG
jgi:hypothetical protein